MRALLQRVTHANVIVDDKTVGEIKQGLLVFVGFEKTDTGKTLNRMLDRLLNYRIFSDENDRMNLSVKDISGGILLVPQFTLVADTKKGMRPGFSSAADPDIGKVLFEQFVLAAKKQYAIIETGVFGANMQVNLCNDGPVTFVVDM